MCTIVNDKILDALDHCLDDVNQPEDEILYGSAGYLQTIIMLKQRLEDALTPIVADNEQAEKKWRALEAKLTEGII